MSALSLEQLHVIVLPPSEYINEKKRAKDETTKREILRLAVLNWYPELGVFPDRGKAELLKRVKEAYSRKNKFGPLFWVIMFAILSAVIENIVTRLIDWWWPQHESRGPLLGELRQSLLPGASQE